MPVMHCRSTIAGMEATTPEVRQCIIDGDQFGSVAVRAGDDRWLVGNPVNGGHWAPDAEVEGWSVGTFTAPEPAPEPAPAPAPAAAMKAPAR